MESFSNSGSNLTAQDRVSGGIRSELACLSNASNVLVKRITLFFKELMAK